MVFTSEGFFKDEVDFNNDGAEENDEESPIAKLREQLKDEEHMRKKKVSRETPVLDFKGNVYVGVPEPPKPPITDLNKMTLLQFSFNHEYFLFHDRKAQKLIVYKLKDTATSQHDYYDVADLKQMVSAAAQPCSWQFLFLYELRFEDCYLFQHLYSANVDAMQYFASNPELIKLDNQGQVKMCYC